MGTSGAATLHALLDGLAAFGDRNAVGVRGEVGLRWWTYSRLVMEIGQVASRLRTRGIGRGDAILLQGPNSPEWVAWLLGAVHQGVTVVPIDADSSPSFLRMVAGEVSARLLVHAAKSRPDAADHLPALPLLSVETPHGEPVAAPPRATIQPDDVAVIVFTSGTTSKARGVLLTHRNVMTQIVRFSAWRLLLRAVPFRLLTIAPMSHVQGLMLGAFIPLSVGLSVVFVPSLTAAHLFRTIRDYRVTLLATVPRVLQVMTRFMNRCPLRSGMTLGEKLSGVRRGFVRRHYLFTCLNDLIGYRFWVILVGGAALDRSDEQFWRDTGRFVLHGYGLTETTALASFSGPFSRRAGSIGRVRPDTGLQVAPDGEVLVRGPHVSPGYFGETIHVEGKANVLHTGDLVRLDEKGYLYFVGRKKEMLVTGEAFNVFPEEVEAVLNRQPGVIDSAVVGLASNGCEEVHSVLLLDSGADAADIVSRANRQLEPHQRIRSWTIWNEPDFPRTNLLKVRREQLRERAAGELSSNEAGATSTLSLGLVVRTPDRKRRLEMLAQYLCEARLSAAAEESDHLVADLGVSSLDVVVLTALVEQQRNTFIDRITVGAATTVADLRRQIELIGTTAETLPARQPIWSQTVLAGALRRMVTPVVVKVWSALGQRVTAVWHTNPEKLVPPVLLAAAPHKHWRDAFAIACALPGHIRRRMVVVTNRDFGEYFDHARGASAYERLKIGAAYYVGLPLVFPFTVVHPSRGTREGLLETARYIDRGFCPLTFPKGIHFGHVDLNRHDPGTALLALECGIPVLPIILENNDDWTHWPRLRGKDLRVHILPPVVPAPGLSAGEFAGLLEHSLSMSFPAVY